MVNYSRSRDRLRVICPKCDHSGANSLGYQPKCHLCGTLMEPASNNKIECTWQEFQEFVNENS